MKLELIKATIDQKALLANLLELYAYDFTEFYDLDIGDNGFYGYESLPLYWTDPDRFPYLIYISNQLAGFLLVQKGPAVSDNTEVYDISEFFIMRKYKRRGAGTCAALKVWEQFKGEWQVRVLLDNERACIFWPQAIKKFTPEILIKTKERIKEEDWVIYRFKSE